MIWTPDNQNWGVAKTLKFDSKIVVEWRMMNAVSRDQILFIFFRKSTFRFMEAWLARGFLNLTAFQSMECLLCHAYCILYVILWITFPFPLAIFYPCYFQWGLISWVFNNNFSFDRLETITTFLVLAKKKRVRSPWSSSGWQQCLAFCFLPFSLFLFF